MERKIINCAPPSQESYLEPNLPKWPWKQMLKTISQIQAGQGVHFSITLWKSKPAMENGPFEDV
jgi:hypothetical protein